MAGSQTSPWAASAAHCRDFLEIHSQNCGHRADAHRDGFLHILSAIAHGAHGIRETYRAGGDVGGVFAQAVSGDEAGVHALLAQNSPGRDGRGQDCGLRDFRQPQFLFRTFEAKLRKLVAEGFIGFVESLPGDGIFFRQFFAHPDSLRALAGKEKGDGLR